MALAHPPPTPERGTAPYEAATLAEMLARATAHHGGKTALQVLRQGVWVRVSFAELLARARAWGKALGVAPGERVLLVAGSSPEWGVAYFAVMLQRGTVVPLDPQLSVRDLQAMATRTDAQVWLLSSGVANAVRAELPDVAVRIIEIDGLLQQPAGEEAVDTAGGNVENKVASILFTSGTTLAPKGVPLTHENLLANVRAILRVISVDARDQYLCVLPLYHILGFTCCLLKPLTIGATVTFVEQLTPKAMLEAMQGSGSTVVVAVPRLYALLVRGIQAHLDAASPVTRLIFRLALLNARAWRWIGQVLPPLAPALRALRALLFRGVHRRFGGRIRYFCSGGAALPPQYFDALDLFGFRVNEGYGLTETSPVLTLSPPDHHRRGTVGPPVPGVEVRIIDAEADGIGHVLARGPSVFHGYLDDPEATQRAFADDWFRTGDLGWFDRAGYLHLAGRADDVIVTGGGKNVYPDELEWLYCDLPRVKECCVIGLPDPGSAGEAVHAVVVLEDVPEGQRVEGCRREVEAAIAQRARQLPTYQRIRGVHFWEGDLPRTSTLKVKRRQVREALIGSKRAERAVEP